MNVRVAAKNFGVPKSTISDYVKKGVHETSKKSGPPTVLTKAEETQIVEWIIYRAEHGTPVIKDDLLTAVQQYVTAISSQNVF